MNRGLQGVWRTQKLTGESYNAFLPNELRPSKIIDWNNSALVSKLELANRSLGRLDGFSRQIPNLSLFIYYYVRKEALVSSQIEGTQSSLSELLLYESNYKSGIPFDDVMEVSSYVDALEFGVEQFKSNKPLSLSLMRKIHERLLSNSRGRDKLPGEFRKSQNWIDGSRPGNAMYVPPPASEVINCMGALENFLHDKHENTPTLIKVALFHLQFETIHPFLDGNGRLGRLMIPLILCYEKALTYPVLYLSLFFKLQRTRYYELLQKVRLEGDWELWLDFFLEGVQETSDSAVQSIQNIDKQINSDLQKINSLAKKSAATHQLFNWISSNLVFSITDAVKVLNVRHQAAASHIGKLISLGIVKEITGRKTKQIFAYDPLLKILEEGTEPLPR